MTHRTPLYDAHLKQGAKMVEFGGWDMPIHYGSLMEEHHAVRQHAGMFDVSHMTIVDVTGTDAYAFCRYLLANDAAKLKTPGMALYSCMLNENGGIVDDLILYFIKPNDYRWVVNAATRDNDIAWINQHAKQFDVTIDVPTQYAMIAIQGPQARELTHLVLPNAIRTAAENLKPFHAVLEDDMMVARTGYTGEDGYELTLPENLATDTWQQLINTGVKPCGLGARDTLRLEAGLPLYGHDMNDTTTPLVTGLAWTVNFQDESREFIGKTALLAQKESGLSEQFIGLILEAKGVLREGQTVHCESEKSEKSEKSGYITSGTFSPTLQKSIALARLKKPITPPYTVNIRQKYLPVQLVKPRFFKQGQSIITPL